MIIRTIVFDFGNVIACFDHQRAINRLRELTVSFWQKRRRARWTINWRFTTAKAKEWVKFFVTEH